MRSDIENNSKEISKLKAEKREMAEKLEACSCKCGHNSATIQTNDSTQVKAREKTASVKTTAGQQQININNLGLSSIPVNPKVSEMAQLDK